MSTKKDLLNASNEIMNIFTRAGAKVVDQNVSTQVKRTNGISYREITLNFADSQNIVLCVRQSVGDIFKVFLNGEPAQIKSQADIVKATDELVAMMRRNTKGGLIAKPVPNPGTVMGKLNAQVYPVQTGVTTDAVSGVSVEMHVKKPLMSMNDEIIKIDLTNNKDGAIALISGQPDQPMNDQVVKVYFGNGRYVTGIVRHE
jgi:Defence against restriction A N-terminal